MPAVSIREEIRPVKSSRVRLDHPHILIGNDISKRTDEVVVDLDGGDLSAGFRQCQSERSQTSANLNNRVTGTRPRQLGDATHGVGIDHKILTEPAERLKTVTIQNLTELLR